MIYREEKLAKARVAAGDIAADPQTDAVYLAGSLTAGLGSPTSDVDVYVIVSSSAPTGARQVKATGERLDVETYTREWVETALRKVEEWETERTDLRSKGLSEEQLDVLVRMRDIEVVKNSPALESFRDVLRRNDRRLRQLTLSAWALEANGHLSDFKGSYQDGDLESAALIGQTLLVCAGKAIAAAAGDLYIGRKWVYRQLRRSVGEKFPIDVFSSLQAGGWTGRQPGAGALEFLSFLQTSAAAAQLLGWNSPLVTVWPFWLPGERGYRRDPQYNVIHLTHGVLLNSELRRQFVVKPDVALVWGLCNGRNEDEITEAAITLGPHVVEDGDQPIDADRARHVIGMLDQRCLISRTLFR